MIRLMNCVAAALGAVIAFPAPTAVAQTQDMGPIYNPVTGTTYYRTTPQTWTAQQAWAQTRGGNLVTVSNAAENTFVRDNFIPGTTGNTVLIGLNDAAAEGQYVWASGLGDGYRNWALGEPNNSGNEDYTQMYSDGRWNDCNNIFMASAVTEVANDSCHGAIPLSVPASLTASYTPRTLTANEYGCGHEYAVGRAMWYRIVGHGGLINVSTCGTATNFDTTLRVMSGALAGLSCIAGNDDACDVQSTVVFYAEAGRTYYILVGSFLDKDSTGTFALSVTTAGDFGSTFLARSEPNPDDCSRYFVVSNSYFFRHEAVAESFGMHLASVADAQDNAFIRSFADSAAGFVPVSIGGTDIDAPGTFSWVDGSPWGYTNWYPGEPNGGQIEYFIEMLPDGRWNDMNDGQRPGVLEVGINAQPGGRIRGAVHFSGGGDVAITSAAFPWPTAAFTLECWFRTGAGGVIFGQFGSPGGHVPMLYVGSDGRLRAAQWAGSVEASSVASLIAVNDGQWHHAAYTYDGASASLYVDGVFNGARPLTPVSYAGSYSYFIGTGNTDGWPASSAGGFNGDIDELRVSTIARSQAQIRATKDTRYFRPQALAGYLACFDFDEAGGRIAFDTTHNNPPGVIEGAHFWLYEDRNGDKVVDACQPQCPADINGDGVVNSTDVSEFINTWFADQTNGTLNADFNRDGVSNSTDVSDMINAYFEAGKGCA